MIEFKKFENLMKVNGWTDEQAGEIYHSLIEDEIARAKLTINSYTKLRKELLNIMYPKAEGILLLNRMELLKQENYVAIDEYYLETESIVRIYSIVYDLNQSEMERKLYEIFYKGLGRGSSLEIIEQNVNCENYNELLNYSHPCLL